MYFSGILSKKRKTVNISLGAPVLSQVRQRVFFLCDCKGKKLFFAIKFIIHPAKRIFGDIFGVFFIVFSISDDMIVKMPLPNVFAEFFITKPFKGRHKARHEGMLPRRFFDRRGRRPRRPVSQYKKHQMNMVWHDHILIYLDILIKFI